MQKESTAANPEMTQILKLPDIKVATIILLQEEKGNKLEMNEKKGNLRREI